MSQQESHSRKQELRSILSLTSGLQKSSSHQAAHSVCLRLGPVSVTVRSHDMEVAHLTFVNIIGTKISSSVCIHLFLSLKMRSLSVLNLLISLKVLLLGLVALLVSGSRP